jgi:uncharacterized protein
MAMQCYILIFSFFFIALIYASVGFGGGSSYLALMALMAVSVDVMRPAALLCNIIVVIGGTIIYYRENLVDLRRSWPFLIASVPFAFVGGLWPIKENVFFILLGISLVVASLLLWIQGKETVRSNSSDSQSIGIPLALGAGIGLLSGLVSIGGGIFLSPVLHFFKWDNARKISALASLFILVNSISGLAGHLIRSSSFDWTLILPLLLSVFVGGQIGSRLGARYFNMIYIKRITAVLIMIAGLNILKDHL